MFCAYGAVFVYLLYFHCWISSGASFVGCLLSSLDDFDVLCCWMFVGLNARIVGLLMINVSE